MEHRSEDTRVQHPIRWIVTIAVLMELSFSSFYLVHGGPGDVLLLIAVHTAGFILLAVLVWLGRNAEIEGAAAGRIAWIVVGCGVLFRLTLVPHAVVGSDDIYRYLWDGKVAAAGINPFAYLPTDPHLSHLATADLPGKVNHPDMRTVYPAVAQCLFLVSSIAFGDSPAGIKLLLVLFDCLTMIVLRALLRQSGKSPLLVVLYAWSPLPILYFGLDGHIDALGIALLILALYYVFTHRMVRGMIALGLSALAKLIPLLVVPLLLRDLRGIRRRALLTIPVVMTAVGFLAYLGPSGGTDSLKMFGERWEFNGSIFSVVYFLSGSNEIAHQVSAILIVVYMLVLTLVDRPLLEKVFWGFTGVILLSPVVHPWYLTWLASLLVLRWSTAVFVYLGLSVVANVVVYQYRAFGQWVDQPLLLLIEYVPVAILLAREIARGRFLARQANSL